MVLSGEGSARGDVNTTLNVGYLSLGELVTPTVTMAIIWGRLLSLEDGSKE